MPKFLVTTPNGEKIEVNAPDGATEDDAIEFVATTWKPTPVAAPKAEGPSFFDTLKQNANSALDVVSDNVLPRTLSIALDVARGRSSGAGIGKPESVLQGKVLPEPEFNAAEAEPLSNRRYAELTDPARGASKAPSARPANGKFEPFKDRGILKNAALSAEANLLRAPAAGGAKFLSDVTGAVGLDGASAALNDSSRGNKQIADKVNRDFGAQTQLNEADVTRGGLENFADKYAPQVLAQLPQVALSMLGGGITLPYVLTSLSGYADAREKGLDPLKAAEYAMAMGGFEAIGEKLGGTGKLADAFESALKQGFTKNAVAELGATAFATGLKEIPSELVTFTGQSGVDNLYQVNPVNAEQFKQGALDTAIVAAGSGGMIGGAGAIVNRAAGGTRAPTPSALDIAKSKGFLTPESAPVSAPTVESQPTTPKAPAVGLEAILKREGLVDGPTDGVPSVPTTGVPAGGADAPATVAAGSGAAAGPGADSGAGQTVAPGESVQPAAPGAVAGSVIPSTADPRTAALAAIEQSIVESKARQEAAALAKAEAEKAARAEADASAAAAPTPNFAQTATDTAQPTGAVPVPGQAQAVVDKATKIANDNADMRDEAMYPVQVLTTISNNPKVGPDIQSAARSEISRRQNVTTQTATANETRRAEDLSGQSVDIPERQGPRPLSVERGLEIAATSRERALMPQEQGYMDALKAEIGDTAFSLVQREGARPYAVRAEERKFDLPRIIEENNTAIAQWDGVAQGREQVAPATPPATPVAQTTTPAPPLVSMQTTSTLSPQAQSLQTRMRSEQNAGYGTNTGTTSAGVDSTAGGGRAVGQRLQRESVGTQTAADTQSGQYSSGQTAPAAPIGSAPTTLTLAPKGSLKAFTSVRTALVTQKPGLRVALSQAPLTDDQKVASAFIQALGGTFNLVEEDSTTGQMPNGFVDGYNGRNYYFDAKSSTHAPLVVAVHEGVHGLPERIRKPLIAALNAMAPAKAKSEFVTRYGYSKLAASDKAEEVGAYLAQLQSERPEFWQELRQKMGNKDFSALATHILSKLKEMLGRLRDAQDSTFLTRHFNEGEIAKMRGMITDAYTQAMREQGLQPDAAVVSGGPVYSQKQTKPLADTYSGENKVGVIVGGKPGEFNWNFHNDEKAPPFAAPTQGIAPRLSKVGPAVQKMLLSKGFKDIAASLGITNLTVTPTRGSWKGQEEPSFVINGDGMTFENANELSKILGFGMAQDATIVTQPVFAGEEDTWPAIYIGNGKKLTQREIDATIKAAKAEGLDYTTSTDGHAFKFFFDGSEYGDFAVKVGRVRDAAGFAQFASLDTRSQFNDSKDYQQSGDQQGQRQDGDNASSSGPSGLFGRTVDHVLIPYAKAVGAEGYRFSPDRFAQRFNLTDAQRGLIEDKLRPKNGLKRSTADIVSGEEDLPVGATSVKGKTTNTDVMTALQNRAAQDGLMDPSDRSEATKKVMAEAIADEIVHHISRPEGKSAIGWYDAALKKAKDIYHSVFPEVNTNVDREMLFDAVLGIASQGNDVHSNSLFAARVFQLLRTGSTMADAMGTLNGTFGVQTRAIELNYKKLQELLDRNGYQAMRKSFNKRQTVGEWNAELRKNKDLWSAGKPLEMEGAAEQSVTGWFVFGPKIGSFINNLHGDYSTLTADLWFSRSWNRLLGHMFHHTPQVEGEKYNSFRTALLAEQAGTEIKIAKNGKESKWQHGKDVTDMPASELDALLGNPEAMLVLAQSLEKTYRKSGYKVKSDLRRAAKTWIEFRENPVDAPRTDTERAFQQKTMEAAQKIVKRKTGMDISIADMQAALWYHEKELYAKLGVGSKTTAPADYADAAADLKRVYEGGDLFKREDDGTYIGGDTGEYLNTPVVFSNKAQDLNQDITLDIPVEGGKTAKLTVNAQRYIDQLNAREDALRMVKECMV